MDMDSLIVLLFFLIKFTFIRKEFVPFFVFIYFDNANGFQIGPNRCTKYFYDSVITLSNFKRILFGILKWKINGICVRGI